MSQEANTSYMNRRYEPMGGELESSNGNTPSVVTSIGRQTNFAVLSPEDNFIDDLTLRVRSLLKSWEDDFPNDDSSNVNQIQGNGNSSPSTLNNEFQMVKSAEFSDNSFISSKFDKKFKISSELKCHGNDLHLNPDESFSEISSIDSKNPDFTPITQYAGVKTFRSSGGMGTEVSKCFPLLSRANSQNTTEFQNDEYLGSSRVSNNGRPSYDLNDSGQSLRKTSTPIQSVEDPLSYNDFSSSLQDVKNTSNASKKNINVPFVRPAPQLSKKLAVAERNSKQNIKNLNPHSSLNATTSTDLYSRESSDKETERSWSEITIVAESYSESFSHPTTLSTENRNDFCNANSPQPASFKNSPKVNNPSVRVKENINLSKSTNVPNEDTKMGIKDWRIEITDHDKPSQESDKEYQFSDFLPNSNMSDLDRDTPPLSASSMASSKRLEWDNGADIGYNVAVIRSKVKYRSIPRSEPEGISFINEAGTNTGPSQVILPSFASMSSQDEPVSTVSSHLDGVNSGASSMHDPSVTENLLERSSSPGSLSRSDSKKSVIYNSFKNTLSGGRVGSTLDPSFIQTQKNSSWPDLTLKSSVPAVSPSKILSKSDEHVGATKCSELKLKQSHFPVFNSSGDNINKFTDSTRLPERILPIGDCFPPELQSFPTQDTTGSIFHSCKNCQSPLSGDVDSSAANIINKKSSDLYNLQEGDLESYEMDLISPNGNQTINSSQLSHQAAGGDWTNENDLHSDLNYITELPEFAGYELQSLNSRPFLLLSHDSSRLKGSNFPSIVQDLFHGSSSGDHSANGNLEVKPHIRWYPFPSTSNLQDIKNVSTQTSVSFIAKQQTDPPVQVADQQLNHRDVSCEALETCLRRVHLDKLSDEILDNSSPFTSTLSTASAAVNKRSQKSQISLNERTNTTLTHPVASEVAMTTRTHANSCGNEFNDKLYLTKLKNSPGRNLPSTESCLSQKSEVEKREKMSSFTNPTSSLDASIRSASYNPFNVCSDERCDSDDLSYLHSKNVISQSPSKYIYSGDIPASYSKRRVGVGQCQTSPESVSSKDLKENCRMQPDRQSRENRNSSNESLSENSEKDESILHSSELFGSNYSTSAFSRFVSHQLIDGALSYDHSQSNYKQNLDDTIPLTTAYNQSDFETTSNLYNASSTIPFENSILNPDVKVNCTSTDFERSQTNGPSAITKNIIQADSLSQIHSENPPFCIFKQLQNRVIHKSHSDPLISSQNPGIDVTFEDKYLLQSQLPPVSRKIDFESSRDSEASSCERIEVVETASVKHSNIKDIPKLHQPQHILSRNPPREAASHSYIFEKGSFSKKRQIPGVENKTQSSILPTDLGFTNGSRNSFLNEQNEGLFSGKGQLPVVENTTQSTNLPIEVLKFTSGLEKSFLNKHKHLSSGSIQKSFEHLDAVDEVHQISADMLSRLKYVDVPQRNYASVGIQVSQSIPGSEKCSFCNKSKYSHVNCCFKKEIFKTVLDQTLAKKLPEMRAKSTTSFCAFPSGCYCCCNKTLQEAFNFHRSEIVERIELRKKEVEEKCKKKLFLYASPSPNTKPKQTVVKLRVKHVADVNRKNSSNKEKNKIKKSESSSLKNTSSQKGRQRNLNKYNRIMSKIYSQRLKNETLKGKVNHLRHEILINS